jgi:hypothetical protein
MQFKQVISGVVTATLLAGMVFSSAVEAGPKVKTYGEMDFLKAFSGKSRKLVSDALGQPVRKEQSVKPANADAMISKAGRVDNSKPVNVEMWYYANVVKYDARHTYKSVEMTFVNDRCQNIAFFNNR